MSAELWARWRPEIIRAIQPDGHQTIDSIERDLIDGHAKLWANERCCVVVEFHRYAGGALACQIRWAAGTLDALTADLAELEKDVKAAGCTEVLISGRAGWARAFRQRGYEPWSLTVRKEL